MKDHEIRELVSELTQIAQDYGQTQQLREHIREAVFKVLTPSFLSARPQLNEIDGWKLVPVEPTEKMLTRGMGADSTAINKAIALNCYVAMLDAAPPSKPVDAEPVAITDEQKDSVKWALNHLRLELREGKYADILRGILATPNPLDKDSK
jgi:hypothetical protein